ncbi:siroheme synthase [Fistulina hepatica ATCC 64428]|nr:siroheme synthase [Fistulina hepatica ATCC 64428]
MSSLLIAWQLDHRNVLIVGGGEVASQRIQSILPTNAHITILAPSKGVNARTREFIASNPDRISYYNRKFTGSAELHKMDMVLTALNDTARSREIVELCREAKIPVNAADIPDCCDFYFGSQIRDGPLQIMISTNATGPRLSHIIKTRVEKALSGYEGRALEKVGRLREKLRERAPGTGGSISRRRMKWISNLCDNWDMENFAALDNEMIERLLDQGWEQNTIPSFEDVGGRRPTTLNQLPWEHLRALLTSSATSFVTGAACTALLFTLWTRRR